MFWTGQAKFAHIVKLFVIYTSICHKWFNHYFDYFFKFLLHKFIIIYIMNICILKFILFTHVKTYTMIVYKFINRNFP